MKKFLILLLVIGFSTAVFSAEKRDLLQKEASKIDLAQALVKNFSDLNFPTYKSRDFWNNFRETCGKNTFRKQKHTWIMTGRQ